jgi:predicted DNA-binding antitoxin AbrB/MazE fold protein
MINNKLNLTKGNKVTIEITTKVKEVGMVIKEIIKAGTIEGIKEVEEGIDSRDKTMKLPFMLEI